MCPVLNNGSLLHHVYLLSGFLHTGAPNKFGCCSGPGSHSRFRMYVSVLSCAVLRLFSGYFGNWITEIPTRQTSQHLLQDCQILLYTALFLISCQLQFITNRLYIKSTIICSMNTKIKGFKWNNKSLFKPIISEESRRIK